MVGLVPTIHVLASLTGVQDVDARHKGEHDAHDYCASSNSSSTVRCRKVEKLSSEIRLTIVRPLS